MKIHASSLRLYPPLIVPTGQQGAVPGNRAPSSESRDNDDTLQLSAAGRTQGQMDPKVVQALPQRWGNAAERLNSKFDPALDPRARKALAAYLEQSLPASPDLPRPGVLDIYV